MSARLGSATIIDVAEAAGVSKSSAARVLSGHGSVSRTTITKVLQAARQLGYRPNRLAKAMKLGTTQTIGIALPDVSSPFFSAVLRGFSDTARGAEFEVIISNTDNDAEIEARSVEILAENRVDGIAVAPVLGRTSMPLQHLAAEGIPIVLIDRRLSNLVDIPLCTLDHVRATEYAIDELVAHGHTRIAIVTEADPDIAQLSRMDGAGGEIISVLKPSQQRLLGYLRSLRRNGLAIDPALIRSTAYSADAAEENVTALLAGQGDITAVHCTDEVLTYGAYRAFVRAKFLPPERLSFVGFDDQSWTTLVQPHVTVVEQAKYELGVEAATMLLAAIDGRASEGDHILPATLLHRGTVVPVAAEP